MASMTVRYDADEGAWVFSSGDLGPGAPVSLAFGGLRWVVSNLACATPWQVEVDGSLPRWAVAAVTHLLGPDAAIAITRFEDAPEPVEVELDRDAADRRAAMGMLAVASAQPNGSALRPLDIAALAGRAGIDGLAIALPELERIADAALEVLEVLPSVVLEALDPNVADDPAAGPRAAGWGIARAGVADAGRLIYRATGEPPFGVDIDTVFDALTAELAAELLDDLAHAPLEPVFMGDGDHAVPRFRGGGPRPRALADALVVDTDIRGIVGIAASFDPGSRSVSVALTTRSLALHPASPRLLVRVIAEQTGAVIACVPLDAERSLGAGARLSARITVPDDVEPARVEVLLDERQPTVELVVARQLHRTYELMEAERVLRQSSALIGDINQRIRDERERVASAILRGSLADLPEGFELDVFPLPSDGVMVVLSDLADRVKEGLRAIERPAERAAAARNTYRLGAWSVMPSVHKLLGDLAMIEAEASLELDDRPIVTETRAEAAARRAVTAYTEAGEHELAADARAWAERNGGRP